MRLTFGNVENTLLALKKRTGKTGWVQSAAPYGYNLYIDEQRIDHATGKTLRQVQEYLFAYMDGFSASQEGVPS